MTITLNNPMDQIQKKKKRKETREKSKILPTEWIVSFIPRRLQHWEHELDTHSRTVSSLTIQTCSQLKTGEKTHRNTWKTRLFNLALQRGTCFTAKKKSGWNLAVSLKGFMSRHPCLHICSQNLWPWKVFGVIFGKQTPACPSQK